MSMPVRTKSLGDKVEEKFKPRKEPLSPRRLEEVKKIDKIVKDNILKDGVRPRSKTE